MPTDDDIVIELAIIEREAHRSMAARRQREQLGEAFRDLGTDRKKRHMNAERRKALEAIHSQLEALKDELEQVASAEREAFDNMPESLQQGDKGQASEAAADALDEAVNGFDEIMNKVEEAKGDA